jgi:hypothetical protein
MKRTKREIIEMHTYIRVQMSQTEDWFLKEILQNLYCAVQEIEIKEEDED